MNLGLIPSSEPGWHVACRALKPKVGGILHVHGNVTSNSESFIASAGNITNIIEPNIVTNVDTNPNERINPLTHVMDHSVGNFPDKISVDKTMDSFQVTQRIDTNSDHTEDLGKSKEIQLNSLSGTITQNLDSSLWKCDPNQWKRTEWVSWAQSTARKMSDILIDLHGEEWTCRVLHIERVKSYAAHIHHMVVDIESRPVNALNVQNVI